MPAADFTPEESPHWQERGNANRSYFDDEFPFQEGMPRSCALNGATYELVLRNDEKVKAYVDLSRQYMAEGPEWRAIGPAETPFPSRGIVAAWRRIS